ncbi:MAG: O-antigen ligase family protein [Candidatus Komeilibacteria bacterium]
MFHLSDHNFLFNSLFWLISAIILFFTLVLVWTSGGSFASLFFLLCLLILLAWHRPHWLLWVVVLLYPFNQKYLWWGLDINIPYSDIFILLLALVMALRWLWQVFIRHDKLFSRQAWQDLLPALFLFLAGLLSLTNVWTGQLGDSWRYLWRFVMFNYLLYFWLVGQLVKKPSEWFTVARFIYILGLFLSVMGLVSLFWPETVYSWHMTTPLSWWGLFPWGASHNLLAEALVSIIPISWLWWYKERASRQARYILVGIILMCLVTLLTFSRTGWLVLVGEWLLGASIYWHWNGKEWRKFLYYGLSLAMILLIIYIFTIGQSAFVTSSNAARLAMIDRSWHYFTLYPVLGQGVGTWQPVVSHDSYYVAEFGQPLEQHGVIWKLLAEQGIVGVAVWLAIFIYFITAAVKILKKMDKEEHWRVAAMIALVIIVGQFTFQLFDTGYYSAKMWLPIGLAWSLLLIIQRQYSLRQ